VDRKCYIRLPLPAISVPYDVVDCVGWLYNSSSMLGCYLQTTIAVLRMLAVVAAAAGGNEIDTRHVSAVNCRLPSSFSACRREKHRAEIVSERARVTTKRWIPFILPISTYKLLTSVGRSTVNYV